MHASAVILAMCGMLMLAPLSTAAERDATPASSVGPGRDIAPASSAAEVIRRNVAARGGLEAWRKVNTMVWLGHLERASPGANRVQVPFVMQLERPNLTRFELKEQFDQFTRVFDGQHGWKTRPGRDGRPQTKAFAPEEVSFAQAEYVIDGPLIDCEAKGVTAGLDGIDTVDGRKTYRLSVRLPTGAERKIWIDVKTNLEVRLDRPATSPLAPGKPVSVYYSDYRTEGGLNIPHRIETMAEAGRTVAEASDKLIIDRVAINPTLDAMAFAPPPRPLRRGGGGSLVRIPGGAPTQRGGSP